MKTALFIAIVFTGTLFSQNQDTSYSITAEIGGGYGRFFTTLQFDDLNKNGFDVFARFMWNPEHILSLGIETGYHQLYTINRKFDTAEFGTSNLNLRMSSVPAAVVFSMKLFPASFPEFRLSGGSGVSMIYSNGKFFDNQIDNSQISIYYLIAASYMEPLNKNISVGGEVKFAHFSKLEDSSVSVLFLIVYRIISW